MYLPCLNKDDDDDDDDRHRGKRTMRLNCQGLRRQRFLIEIRSFLSFTDLTPATPPPPKKKKKKIATNFLLLSVFDGIG